MKPLRATHLLVFILLLGSLACNLPSAATPQVPPTMTVAPPTAAVADTAAPPPPSATAPATEPAPLPTEAAPPPEAPPPTTAPSPIPSPQLAVSLPAGFITVPAGGGRVFFYNTLGQITAERSTPNMFPDSTNLYPAGSAAGDLLQLPLVYFTYENGGELLLNVNNEISRLMGAPSFFTLVGVPGQPILAYSSIEWGDALRSTLFIGALESLPSAQPVAVVDDPESWAAKPLAIAVENGQPIGIWYTTVAYGIGGDIVFEPRKTLSYLDLETGSSQHIYDDTINPCGLSPDQTWVAYMTGWDNAGANLTLVHNMDASTAVTIPLLPASDRGAGEVFFSPDNQFVAWKEGSGWMMADVPNFYATIRIATLKGEPVAEITEAAIASVTGAQDVSGMRSVGWLDGQTLLLEVHLDEWDNVSLMRVNFDGSGLATLAPGSFAGFLYP